MKVSEAKEWSGENGALVHVDYNIEVARISTKDAVEAEWCLCGKSFKGVSALGELPFARAKSPYAISVVRRIQSPTMRIATSFMSNPNHRHTSDASGT